MFALSKVWFITGCSTGFGRLVAQELLDQGHRVIATARRVDALADLKAPDPEQLLTLPLDVTIGHQIREATERSVERFGAIDVLINNAGYGYFSTQEEGDVDEIRRMFETNVLGLARVTQAILPHMRERRSGVIMNLSSVAGRVAFPRSGFYSATKWAVEAMSESLHLETRSFGIRVVLIEPGAFETDFAKRSAVRSANLESEGQPYHPVAKHWTDVALSMMPERQDPAEVVDGMIAAGLDGPPFQRIAFGADARKLIGDRCADSDAEFFQNFAAQYDQS